MHISLFSGHGAISRSSPDAFNVIYSHTANALTANYLRLQWKLTHFLRFQSFPTFSTIASRNLHIENLSTRKLHRANGKRENEGGSERAQQAQMGVWYRKRGVCDFDNCIWEGQGIRTAANHRRRANQLSVKKWWWLWRFSLWVERNCWRNWGTVKERGRKGERREEVEGEEEEEAEEGHLNVAVSAGSVVRLGSAVPPYIPIRFTI